MGTTSSRRQMLRGTGAGLAALALPRPGRTLSRCGKLQHASIGVGGMGWADLNQIAAHPEVEIVALCDVDLERAKPAKEKFPQARLYQDWRELFEEEGDRIDSVNVTTPDHMHAPITMTALRRGKHVYCQKPLTHDVHEARRVAAAAAEAGVATQMGVQLTSSVTERQAVQMIRDGAIGKVEKVYLWSNKDTWKYRPTGPRPEGGGPAPEGLDWDKWTGTAPARPYVPEVYHPTFWRGWQDFGVGWLGDMGCHITAATHRALGLGAPIRVRAEVEPAWRDTPARFSETWPVWQILRYTYPGNERTVGETLEVVWSDGYRYPPEELLARIEVEEGGFPAQGAMLLGEEGTLLHPHGGQPSLHPAEKFASYPRPEIAPRNHYHHWIDACRGGSQTEAGFEFSGPFSEAILLGTVALRLPGRELSWDAARMKFEGSPEADRYLRRKYRAGWQVEGL
ncbi:MAG: Gfo/Idh/MocA family oxidoreductase [bacterium]|nr:Gfo/Idh/MocA family oxidoreductase [bacterium]